MHYRLKETYRWKASNERAKRLIVLTIKRWRDMRARRKQKEFELQLAHHK